MEFNNNFRPDLGTNLDWINDIFFHQLIKEQLNKDRRNKIEKINKLNDTKL